MIQHLEALVENMEGYSMYEAPKPLTAFSGAIKTTKNVVFTGLLTLLPVYWFLIVLFITLYSYAWYHFPHSSNELLGVLESLLFYLLILNFLLTTHCNLILLN